MKEKIGSKVQLVGETNTKFFEKEVSEGVANSILVKVNKIGNFHKL